MIRLGSLLLLIASIGFAASADRIDFVIAIDRSAGMKNDKPMDHYRFTVVKDGSWELDPLKGESRKGTLAAEDLDEWIEAIEDGLDEVESNPELGALDESFMDITVQTRNRKSRVRIRTSEELSQAIEEKIVELAGGVDEAR